MGKTDWKAKAKALKKKLTGTGSRQRTLPAKAAKPISPLAPKAAFPPCLASLALNLRRSRRASGMPTAKT